MSLFPFFFFFFSFLSFFFGLFLGLFPLGLLGLADTEEEGESDKLEDAERELSGFRLRPRLPVGEAAVGDCSASSLPRAPSPPALSPLEGEAALRAASLAASLSCSSVCVCGRVFSKVD